MVCYRLVPVYPNTPRNYNHCRELYYRDCDCGHLDDGDDDGGDGVSYHHYLLGILLKIDEKIQNNSLILYVDQLFTFFTITLKNILSFFPMLIQTNI